MNKKPPLPKDLLKLVAAKAEEARGLLELIKPLCKRHQQLTEAEAETLCDVVGKADGVLSAAMLSIYEVRRLIWESQDAARNGTAVKKESMS